MEQNIPQHYLVYLDFYTRTNINIDSGEVFTWGCGENGQLGLGKSQNQLIPQHVRLENSELKTGNESIEVVDVSCGSNHTGLVTSIRHIIISLNLLF